MDYDLNYQEAGDVDVDAIPNKIGDVCAEGGVYECNTCGEELEVADGARFPACENCGDDYLTWIFVRAA